MPNPVPLATREEEERRTWVTAHHEVVKLIKDCFGDRFSNNEIFDRLKISRRTGYRALGNDERIGKAPGRKPKISEETIKGMVDYIESGGCTEVGNVWKHLAEKFAPDCNPKTVQDAVKKSGFKNNRDTVKLEPLLNEIVNEDQPAPIDDITLASHTHPTILPSSNGYTSSLSYNTPLIPVNVIDPTFQPHSSLRDILKTSIDSTYDNHIRWILWQICCNSVEAENMAIGYLCPQLTSQPLPQMQTHALHPFHSEQSIMAIRKPRPALCRRCQGTYDRGENTMENRSCLYHKGAPVKTQPGSEGSIKDDPEAYTWSCCGGNGLVRGCCRAMHTTKKKRKYGKKRDASEAGLDEKEEEEDSPTPGVEGDRDIAQPAPQRAHLNGTNLMTGEMRSTPAQRHVPIRPNYRQMEAPLMPTQQQRPHHRHQSQLQQVPDLQQDNMDVRLQDMQQELSSQQIMSDHGMMMFQQQLQLGAYDMQNQLDEANGYVQLDIKSDPNDPLAAHPGMDEVARHLQQTQVSAQLPPDYEAQFVAVQGMRNHV